jgi:predicted amidohydrolase|tara:strand:+ start:9523 stop:10251 length:729 start_codon:yes stop_codon:yes gene_type:complete
MVRVAAAQIPVTNSTLKNLDTIINYIKKASSKKVDIVCFPEASLIHSKNKDTIKKIPIKKYIDIIKKSCKKNKIHCIFGTNLVEKNKIYNSAFFIDDKGKVIYRYNKVNLWINERKSNANGRKNNVVKTKFGKIGIIICWDIAYPEYVKKLGKQGAWIIFCPSYVINYNRELYSYEHLPYARAFENSAYFIYCDAYAKNTVRYSYICGPSKIYSKIRNKEGLIVADLDRRKIVGLRRHYGLV